MKAKAIILAKIFVIFQCIYINALCQTNPISSQEEFLNFIPPSPNASELGKYAEIPVNKYTGLPNISIPLFNIKGRDISIPISLNYHASGIKVEQMATWVGLGWSLDAGGVITRAVYGIPDDRYDDESKGLFYSQNSYNFLMSENPTQIAQAASVISAGFQDSEPDIFYFNFLGYTGEFVFDINKNIHLMPKSDLDINYSLIEHEPLTSFTIITDKGVRCVFNQIEVTEDNLPRSSAFNSSWFLSEIHTQFEDVSFIYENEIIYEKKLANDRYYLDDNGTPHIIGRTITPNIKMRCKRLKRIDWSEGYIVFTANSVREDIGNDEYQDYSKALDKITIYDRNNNIVKEYQLNYSYFSDPINNTSYLLKRLKLNSLKEFANGIAKPPYEFKYNLIGLPARNSYEQDYWGYYNGNQSSTLIPNLYAYPSDNNNTNYLSAYSIYRRINYPGNEYILNVGANREPNDSKIKACILEKLYYPTGGYSEFIYEPHQFYFDQSNRVGGGLRIKEIINKATANDISLHTIYDYRQSTNLSLSSGRIIYLPQYAYQRTFAGVTPTNLENLKKVTIISTSSMGGLGATQGSHIGYKEVTTYQVGNGKTITKFDMPAIYEDETADCFIDECIYNRTKGTATFGIYYCGGFTPDYFEYFSEIDNYPYAVNPNYDWSRGQILEEAYYSEDNFTDPIKKVEYSYEIIEFNKIPAATCRFSDFFITIPSRACCDYYESQNMSCPGIANMMYYKVGKYYLISAWKVLKNKKEYEYDKLNKTKFTLTQTDFSYNGNNHHQLTEQSRQLADGAYLNTSYRYINDYNNLNLSNHPLNVPIDDDCKGLYYLKYNHILSIPIEIIQKKDENVISGKFTKYRMDSFTNKVLAFQDYSLELSTPQNSFSFADISGSGANGTLTHIAALANKKSKKAVNNPVFINN